MDALHNEGKIFKFSKNSQKTFTTHEGKRKQYKS